MAVKGLHARFERPMLKSTPEATIFKVGDSRSRHSFTPRGQGEKARSNSCQSGGSCSLANKLDETIRLVVNGSACRKRITSWATTTGNVVDWRSKHLS